MPNDIPGNGAGGLDRRQAQRHDVTRPCRVVPETNPVVETPGVTSNISRSGMLVRFPVAELSGDLPKVGEQARVEIELPPSAQYAPRVLECHARVVRVGDPSTEEPALAFEVLRMEIRDGGENPPSGDERDPLIQ
jgi:hypothetical protein